MPGNAPEALWDNKITVWSNRKLLLLAVSKRQSIVLLLSEIQAMQIHMELATNYWTLIHTGTALGCFQTEVQIKWILSWDAWRQLDGYCLPVGLWRGLCYSFNTLQSIHGAKWYTHMILFWKYPTALCPMQHQPLQLSYPLRSWKKSISLSAHAISTSTFPSSTRVLGEVWLRGNILFVMEMLCGRYGWEKVQGESFLTGPSGWSSSLCTCSPEQAVLASDLQITEC